MSITHPSLLNEHHRARQHHSNAPPTTTEEQAKRLNAWKRRKHQRRVYYQHISSPIHSDPLNPNTPVSLNKEETSQWKREESKGPPYKTPPSTNNRKRSNQTFRNANKEVDAKQSGIIKIRGVTAYVLCRDEEDKAKKQYASQIFIRREGGK